MTEKRTRARLTAEVAALIIGKYPVAWNAKEIALALKAHRRTVERILADLVGAGIVEKRYHSYTLETSLVAQIYGAQWYVRQEIDKQSIVARHSYQLTAINGGK